LDGLWAGDRIEGRTAAALAPHLLQLDARTVRDLKARLDALPPGGSAAAATLRMQDAMLDWIVGEVREAKNRESLLAFLSQLWGRGGDAPEATRAKGRACLEECGGTAEGVLQRAEALRPGAARLARTLDLPPGQVDQGYEREARALAGNPVFKVFAP